MNPRYRCAWCGSFTSRYAAAIREHVIKAHRSALTLALRPLESFPGRQDPEEI